MPEQGVIVDAGDSLHLVAGALVLAGFLGLMLAALVFHRRLFRVLVGTTGILLIIAGVALASLPAPVYGSMIGSGTATSWVADPDNSRGREILQIGAGPGEPYSIFISVANNGPLPIHVVGLSEPGLLPRQFPAWDSVSVSTNAMPPLDGAEDGAEPQSVAIPPQGELVLNAVGQATGCAAGTASEAGSSTDRMTVVYTVLGLTSSAEIHLPSSLFEPQTQGCVTL